MARTRRLKRKNRRLGLCPDFFAHVFFFFGGGLTKGRFGLIFFLAQGNPKPVRDALPEKA